MQLTLCLADAASKDEKGTISAMGLGITRLRSATLPTGFGGALILICTAEERDVGVASSIDLSITAPSGATEPFAKAEFTLTKVGDQVLTTMQFGFNALAPGDYLFRARSGSGDSGALRLLVEQIEPTSAQQ